MKPFFMDKETTQNKINVIEKDEIILSDGDIAKTKNSYFNNAVLSLGISNSKDIFEGKNTIYEKIPKIIKKYSNHPSILNMCKTMKKPVFELN